MDSPGAPRSIATIPHAAYWGINAALSPDGTQLAYVVLPATVPDPEQGADRDGEIWLQPLDGRAGTLLTSGASVRFVPIWSADGRQLVFQTFGRALRSVNLEDGTASALASMPGWSMLPLGFGQRGQLYLARTREGATEIVAVSIPDGALQTRATTLGLEVHQGDLSAGGERACLVGTSRAGEWSVWIVDIGDRASTPLNPQGLAPGQEIISAVWRGHAHPKEAWDAVGNLDEGFPLYYEDSEWSYRARLLGYTVRPAPKAVVYHAFGGRVPSGEEEPLSPRKLRHVAYAAALCLEDPGTAVPVAVLRNYLVEDWRNFWAAAFRCQWPVMRAYLGAWRDALSSLPSLLAQRRRLQARRARPDEELFALQQEIPEQQLWRGLPELTGTRCFAATFPSSARERRGRCRSSDVAICPLAAGARLAAWRRSSTDEGVARHPGYWPAIGGTEWLIQRLIESAPCRAIPVA